MLFHYFRDLKIIKYLLYLLLLIMWLKHIVLEDIVP